MKKFVENKQANDQTNRIYDHVQNGLSDGETAKIFTETQEVNLKNRNNRWAEDDIREIRERFQLEACQSSPYQYKMV